ncbi:hypothetical protein BDN70DRAFT_937110 [Pholiota conissans]|uniref:Uncharacterized protein n=1 Tax=Pholiota conissans TaxID=109636 RepID=A0A9P5YRK7_9AGAR|nr:hypothetical protein BDN70DRAFT_937110 [Pholiota conissans]
MSVHAPRLSRIFTPTYAAHINAQITHQKLGKPSKIVNADDLAFVMASPLKAALQVQPLEKSAAALGANISALQRRRFRTAIILQVH